MKRSIFFLAALMVSVLASAKEYDVRNFSRIEASGIYKINVVKSSEWKVDVTCSEDLEDRIVVKVVGKTLKLSIKDSDRAKVFDRKSFARVAVQMPHLCGVELSGVCTISSEDSFGVKTGDFVLEASGGAKVEGLKVSAPQARIIVSGASKANVMGKFGSCCLDVSGSSHSTLKLVAESLLIDTSGASHVGVSGEADAVVVDGSGASAVTLKAFKAQTLSVDLGGASKMYGDEACVNSATFDLSGASFSSINVTESISFDLSGASKLEYGGSESLRVGKVDVSGASRVIRK